MSPSHFRRPRKVTASAVERASKKSISQRFYGTQQLPHSNVACIGEEIGIKGLASVSVEVRARRRARRAAPVLCVAGIELREAAKEGSNETARSRRSDHERAGRGSARQWQRRSTSV